MDKDGRALHIAKGDIKKFKAQKISLMPGNFGELLTVEEARNIFAYLATLVFTPK
jgi:hypothetical protein